MRALLLVLTVLFSLTSLSAFAVEAKKEEGKICFNDKRTKSKKVKAVKSESSKEQSVVKD